MNGAEIYGRAPRFHADVPGSGAEDDAFPRTGGPYACSRRGFGDFIGFQTAWAPGSRRGPATPPSPSPSSATSPSCTDVDGIQLGYGTPAARPPREATPAALAELELPGGSTGPKAEAARRFMEQGGRLAAIASLEDAVAALDGNAGTIVRRG